ncbi:t-SNARE domain-containing protein 1 [Merluccius polli]|uniref:t-SNARE domain-containing protein 1 n=1 Tax=Merluccius polli TaxID=89951 RepID=A0AA47NE32_MERPO|nr:t-SNARE domain-containing protein 1 [Merluccius polli]
MEDNTDSAKRSKNFSKQELEVLVEEVVVRKKLLMGKLDNISVTAENKKRAWAKVAQSVSSVGGMERDAVAIKRKWADVKSLVKKKAAERSREIKKTGGGTSSIKLEALEERVLEVIGESLVDGVQGGVDRILATPEKAVYSCYSRFKQVIPWWSLMFYPTQLELHPPKSLNPTLNFKFNQIIVKICLCRN